MIVYHGSTEIIKNPDVVHSVYSVPSEPLARSN